MNLLAFRETTNSAVMTYEDLKIPTKLVLEALSQSISLIELDNRLDHIVSSISKKKYKRKHARENLRVLTRTVNPRSWASPTVTTIGGVHERANVILDIYTERQGRVWENFIEPKTAERHFGIEVELVTDCKKSEIIRHAQELGLKGIMQIKRDGSVRPHLSNKSEGFELCFCVAESQLELVLAKAQTLLDRIDATVNQSCGLHIHLDMRDTDRDGAWQRYQNLAKAQNILKRVVTPDRLHNTYCRFVTSSDPYQARNASRYRAINFASYGSKKTIEIRAFQGTTNTTEIYMLCKMLVKMMQTVNPLKRASNSLATLSRIYGAEVTNPMRHLERKYRENRAVA